MHCGVTFKCIIYQQHQLFFFLFMFYNNFHKFVSFKSYFVWKHFTDSESAFSEFFTWKWKSLSHVRLFVTPWTIQFMDFSRPEYWRGRCSLLQGIFPIQGLNPGLPHCRWILYQLSYQGSPGFGLRKGKWNCQTWKEEQTILCKTLQGWAAFLLEEGAQGRQSFNFLKVELRSIVLWSQDFSFPALFAQERL